MHHRNVSMQRILIAVLLSAACLAAADASGKWSGTFKPDDAAGSRPVYMVLTQDGDKLTGTGGPNESEQHPMQKGKVEGERPTFEVPDEGGTFIFDLKITG